MEKETKQTPEEQKPKRVAGEPEIYVEVDGEWFPFGMTVKQHDSYLKSLKKQERSKK